LFFVGLFLGLIYIIIRRDNLSDGLLKIFFYLLLFFLLKVLFIILFSSVEFFLSHKFVRASCMVSENLTDNVICLKTPPPSPIGALEGSKLDVSEEQGIERLSISRSEQRVNDGTCCLTVKQGMVAIGCIYGGLIVTAGVGYLIIRYLVQ
jgi:hypothetical protein